MLMGSVTLNTVLPGCEVHWMVPSWRAMIRDLRRGVHIPGVGTWRDVWAKMGVEKRLALRKENPMLDALMKLIVEPLSVPAWDEKR